MSIAVTVAAALNAILGRGNMYGSIEDCNAFGQSVFA